jgi:hypothetical protein
MVQLLNPPITQQEILRMKHTLLIIMAMLALPSLACTITLPTPPQLTTGPTQTFTVSEALPGDASADKPVKVELRMGAGELTLQSGADGLAEGEIEYNVPEWKPTVTSSEGKLIIEQGPSQNQNLSWFPGKDNEIINNWDLELGNAPMNLSISAGAYKGTLDLSGLHLRNLAISDGASDTEVTFDEANPEVMDKFTYTTGASSVKLNGLGYANFKDLTFKGGAGDYRLNFDGELQQDAAVEISAGMSSIRIEIPSGMNAKVVVSGGMKSVTTVGTWTAHTDTYETSADAKYTLTITVDIGLGSLTLVNGE